MNREAKIFGSHYGNNVEKEGSSESVGVYAQSINMTYVITHLSDYLSQYRAEQREIFRLLAKEKRKTYSFI